jgi:hypothetical protein
MVWLQVLNLYATEFALAFVWSLHGVRKSRPISALWCPHSCEIGTKRLTRLIWLNGLKKVKDSCIH